MSNEPFTALGDLRLYPDGRIELGSYRFSRPSQVQPVLFFDLTIYPSSKSNQDVLVECEGECFVFRFVPRKGEWEKLSITREQLRQMTQAEEPISAPSRESHKKEVISVGSDERLSSQLRTENHILLETESPGPPQQAVAQALHSSGVNALPVMKTRRGIAPGESSPYLAVHPSRRFVAKGGGASAGRIAQALVDRLGTVDPTLKVGLGDYGVTSLSHLAFTGHQLLAVRCVRPSEKQAESAVDLVFQCQGDDLSVSLTHYDFLPSRFWKWMSRVLLSLTIGGWGFILFCGWLAMDHSVDLQDVPIEIVIGVVCAMIGFIPFCAAAHDCRLRAPSLSEQPLSKALPDLALSCLEDVVGARNLQEVH